MLNFTIASAYTYLEYSKDHKYHEIAENFSLENGVELTALKLYISRKIYWRHLMIIH